VKCYLYIFVSSFHFHNEQYHPKQYIIKKCEHCFYRVCMYVAINFKIDGPFWDSNALGLKSWLSRHGLEHNLASRLKYILTCTMGAPNSFEFRREELFELKLKAQGEKEKSLCCPASESSSTTTTISVEACEPNPITDEEVVASFVDSVKPNGFVTRFLKLAEIGVRVGDTVK
jgi:hypothetical protein